MMSQPAVTTKQVPLDIVGSTVFGRYSKINIAETFNMIISDDWLVPYAGYKRKSQITGDFGRAIFSSARANIMIVVVDDVVYAVNNNISVTQVGEISTSTGDVYIDENNNAEIAICDRKNLYCYNWQLNKFTKVTTLPSGVVPGYVSFQNGRFIVADISSNRWYIGQVNDINTWSWGPGSTPVFNEVQTKADKCVAAIRFPGRGNLLFVFGQTVTEAWYNIPDNQISGYQRSSAFNVDYGCLNPATIANNENIIVWLAANNKSGPVIMWSNGSDPQQISTDGINYKLASLKNPSNSYGFLFKQDGHLLYQITFPDDKLSYVYDFNTKKFFTLTDEYMGSHIAKRVAFFNNKYYFVSFKDGDLYEFGSTLTNYDYGDRIMEIPRVRQCSPIREPNQKPFIVNNLTFTIEQGNSPGIQRVDFSMSKNGGISFSSYMSKELNTQGHRMNRLNYWNLGRSNDFVAQFRFWSESRFVCTNGLASIY